MQTIKEQIKESISAKETILGDAVFIKNLQVIIDEIKKCYKNGNKLLIAGNGGSAADAQHFATELVCRYKRERKGYPALALTTDSSLITAWSNDYNFESLFARQIETHGNKGDIFFGISTSGASQNVIEGVKQAKKLGLTTICLLGSGGGLLKGMADVSLIVPSGDTPRVQESHIMLIHIICEEIEKEFI